MLCARLDCNVCFARFKRSLSMLHCFSLHPRPNHTTFLITTYLLPHRLALLSFGHSAVTTI